MIKPFSQACENNGPPILSQLTRLLSDTKTVLEVGSGTGQHAAYFAAGLPQVLWQPSDLLDNHEGINLWVEDASLNNLLAPIEYDVTQANTLKSYDAIFMANTLHIMPWQAVEACIQNTTHQINDNGLLIVYGPFNYEGDYTSESNARFDQWLKAADPERGIREFERIDKLAREANFIFEEDIAMPANNRLLVWRFKR